MRRTLNLILLIACSAGISLSACNHTYNVPYPAQARVAPLSVDELDSRQRALLGVKEGEALPKRAGSDLFLTLMKHPDLFEIYDPLGYSINRSPRIKARDRELLILRTAWLYQGRYEWSQHYEKALAAGLTKDDITRIKTGPSASGWNDQDRALIMAIDSLVETASISDVTYAALTRRYDTQQIMDLITLVTHYHWVSMITKSFGIQPHLPVTDFD